MILMLSEGFWGEKLYAAMAAMRFAANFQMSDEPEILYFCFFMLYQSTLRR